jgi:DNA-binding winged helix-turn-helix (wHTH) protein
VHDASASIADRIPLAKAGTFRFCSVTLAPRIGCVVGLPTRVDAMTKPAGQARDVVSFGPFRLVASERLLTKDGEPVEVGARTLDVLTALVLCPNEVVSKRDLLARVWPDVTVEESSLRFHIAALRKALGDGRDGARYIATAAGRGYCFVAPVVRSEDRADPNSPLASAFPTPICRAV